MTKINFQMDGQTYSMDKFAKEIKLNDVLSCFDAKTLKWNKDIITNMFNRIAGVDHVLQGTELEVFMKEVDDKYAGKDNVLSDGELNNLDKDYGTSLASGCQGNLWAKLISSLFKANTKNLAKEASATQQTQTPSTNTKEKADGSKIVVENRADKSSVESRYDKKGTLLRQITKNPKGEVTEDVEFHKDGTKTYHTQVTNDEYVKETTVTVDKNGQVIRKGKIQTNGTKEETVLENGKAVKIITKWNGGGKQTKYLDNLGRVKDEVSEYYDGYKTKTHCEYYDNSNMIKSKTTQDSYSKTITQYNKEGYPVVETEKYLESGNVTKRFFGKESYDVVKEVSYDKDGKITETMEYTYGDKNGYEPTKEVHKDENGNVLWIRTRKFNQEGRTIQETTVDYDKNGNKRKTKEYTYGDRNGCEPSKEVYKDKNDNVLETITRKFNKDGSTLQEIISDKEGNITTTTKTKNGKETIKTTKNGEVVYTKVVNENPYREIVKNSKGEVLTITESNGKTFTTRSGDGMIMKVWIKTPAGFEQVFYKDGKPYCIEKWFKGVEPDVGFKYTDVNGNEIDRKTFRQLYNETDYIKCRNEMFPDLD